MKTMNMAEHFRTGSALLEFLAGRLGAPDCWTNDRKARATVSRVRRTQPRYAVYPGRIANARQGTLAKWRADAIRSCIAKAAS